ncbi:50S ribosomal protein L7A [Enterococcus canis]|uniref:50S ribosomal protein L7A n=2 Tax=Enterococcus canis TaxID=214095 RepID=A0A1L8RKA6_9ENTE|nr:50S ribosomal protein L7A [Enterococcus canis]
MRAGQLITGEELTVQAIRNGKCRLAFVAADASENTRKKIQDKCSYYNVPCRINVTQMELSQAIGRPRMVVGVMEAGFAKKLQELIKD